MNTIEEAINDTKRHLQVKEDFIKLENKPANYEYFDYIMFLIWVKYVGGENKLFSKSIVDEVYKNEEENISYQKLKKIVSMAYNLGFNNGVKAEKEESNAVLKKKLSEVADKVEENNDEYWKNRIRWYCSHRWKRIPNPISDYDDYVCEICGARK